MRCESPKVSLVFFFFFFFFFLFPPVFWASRDGRFASIRLGI